MDVDGRLRRHRSSLVGNRASPNPPTRKPDDAGDGGLPGRNVFGDDLDGNDIAYVYSRQQASSSRRCPGRRESLGLRVIDDYGFGLVQPIGKKRLTPMLSVALNHRGTRIPGHRTEGGVRTAQRSHPRESQWPSRLRSESIRCPAARPCGRLRKISLVRRGVGVSWRTLNYSVPQNDGHMLTESHWIKPGWRLVLPPSTTNGPGSGTDPEIVAPTVELSAVEGPANWQRVGRGPRPQHTATEVRPVGSPRQSERVKRPFLSSAPD